MSVASSKRLLDPIDRVSEVLFGLIMVLTFTGSLSVAESGREDVRTMLIGALGCNIAWGIIDALLYLMGALAEKGRGLNAFHAVRKTADPLHAQRLIADAMPPTIAVDPRTGGTGNDPSTTAPAPRARVARAALARTTGWPPSACSSWCSSAPCRLGCRSSS